MPLLRLSAQVQSDEQNWSTLVHGTTPAYFQIRRWSTSRGVLLADSDQDSGAKHVLLGQTVAEKLFGASADPVGQLVLDGGCGCLAVEQPSDHQYCTRSA